MSESNLTFIAALVAAGVSLVTFFIGVSARARSEVRAANRRALEPHLEALGQALHEIVATTVILRKANEGPARENWRSRAVAAQQRLKAIRPKVRYPLWGLDEPLRVMSRFPNWMEHARRDEGAADEIGEAMDTLRRNLDVAIKDAFASGRPPGALDRCLCGRSATRVRERLERFMGQKEAEDQPD